MKNKLFMILLITIIALSVYAIQEKGWVNNHTFRVVAIGKINPRHIKKPRPMRDKTSCEAARLKAMSKIVERFAEANIDSVKGGKLKITKIKNIIIKDFSGVLYGGRVVKSTFDPKKNQCKVVYEIHEKNLRRKVREAVKKQK